MKQIPTWCFNISSWHDKKFLDFFFFFQMQLKAPKIAAWYVAAAFLRPLKMQILSTLLDLRPTEFTMNTCYFTWRWRLYMLRLGKSDIFIYTHTIQYFFLFGTKASLEHSLEHYNTNPHNTEHQKCKHRTLLLFSSCFGKKSSKQHQESRSRPAASSYSNLMCVIHVQLIEKVCFE